LHKRRQKKKLQKEGCEAKEDEEAGIRAVVEAKKKKRRLQNNKDKQ
jgi:hypothetical protein